MASGKHCHSLPAHLSLLTELHAREPTRPPQRETQAAVEWHARPLVFAIRRHRVQMNIIGLLALLAATASTSTAQQQANTTTPVARNGTHASLRTICNTPKNKAWVGNWYYQKWSNGPHADCYWDHNPTPWIMLNAYRSGGQEGLHWKYTDDPHDSACLTHWLYFSANGHEVIAYVQSRTTFHGDSRRWCALPVYRTGGVEGKQWINCECYGDEYPY